MATTLKTAPAEEPLTTDEAKEHLRVDDADEDDYIDSLIIAARWTAETYTHRQLVTATWYQYLDRFPGVNGIIRPLYPTLQSVTEITYYDSAGALQTLSADDYQVDIVSEPGRILPEPNASWPSTEAGRSNAIIIEYVAGYGAASAVPNGIKQAMLLFLANWYENRENVVVGTIVTNLPFAAEALLKNYEVPYIA